MEEKDEFIPIQDLQNWLGISRSQSYSLLKSNSGPLPAYRIGGSIRIKRKDVEEWLEDHRYETNDESKGS